MQGRDVAFVHVLLFQCPKCGSPLSAHRLAENGNLEEIDGSSFDLMCSCGWKGDRPGIRARKHWVEPWQ